MTVGKCTTCDKPATLWVARDPFGKSDAGDLYCADHAPKFTFTPCPCGVCTAKFAPKPTPTARTNTSAPEFQSYWKCEHWPQALKNFQDKRHPCGICTEPPAWWSNGENRKPKSWSMKGTNDC